MIVRKVVFSVLLPVTVTAYVEESEDGDLTIKSLHSLSADHTARYIAEQMTDEDLEVLEAAFKKAPEYKSRFA